MAQQTAVDWLVKELKLQGYDYTVEQAKQMEKQQRITDYNIGYQDAQCNHINDAENYVYESSN